MRTHLRLVASVLVVAGCGGDPQVSRAEVERVLSTLAADDMEGRAAFSPAIDRAASFIASEFESIGLEPLPGADAYRQAFRVYGNQVDSVRVVLDGAPVPSARVVVSAGGPSVSWDGPAEVELVRVGADEPPASWVSAGTSALVLLDEAHGNTFEALRAFLDQPRLDSTRSEGPTRVFVLGASGAETFSVRVWTDPVERELANVVGVLPGRRPSEMVLFSAHYDHIGIRPAVDGDSIANGANDNASGTTGVIELARYFAALGTPERTLVFSAFTAEEAGGLGSRYFSERLDPARIVAMFNLEMIGKPAVSGPNSAWITGWDRSDFGTILQEAVEGTAYTFYADPYPEQNLFYRSDNATLARLGVPAHSISTTPIDVDTDYHGVSDEVSTLNLDHLTNTIRAIAAGARTIVSGERTPTRVDPATVD